MRNEALTWREIFVLVWCGALGLIALLAIVPGFPAVGKWLSADTAPAWVQAIGSIAAIVAAAWIASAQERRSAHAAKARAVRKIRTFAALLQACIEQFREKGSRWKYHAALRRLLIEEALIDARLVNSEVLNLDWVAAFHAMRSIAVQVCEVCRRFEASPDEATSDPRYRGIGTREDYSRMTRDVAEYESKLAEHVKLTIAGHPGVRVDQV